jgi:hypothetical protein
MDVEKNLENLLVYLDHVVINLQVNFNIQMRFEHHLESVNKFLKKSFFFQYILLLLLECLI